MKENPSFGVDGLKGIHRLKEIFSIFSGRRWSTFASATAKWERTSMGEILVKFGGLCRQGALLLVKIFVRYRNTWALCCAGRTYMWFEYS